MHEVDVHVYFPPIRLCKINNVRITVQGYPMNKLIQDEIIMPQTYSQGCIYTKSTPETCFTQLGSTDMRSITVYPATRILVSYNQD